MIKTKTRRLNSSEINALTSHVSEELSRKRKEKLKEFEEKLKNSDIYKQHSDITTRIKTLESQLENLKKDRDSIFKKIEFLNPKFGFSYDNNKYENIMIYDHSFNYRFNIKDAVIVASLRPDFDIDKVANELINKFSK